MVATEQRPADGRERQVQIPGKKRSRGGQLMACAKLLADSAVWGVCAEMQGGEGSFLSRGTRGHFSEEDTKLPSPTSSSSSHFITSPWTLNLNHARPWTSPVRPLLLWHALPGLPPLTPTPLPDELSVSTCPSGPESSPGRTSRLLCGSHGVQLTPL